MKLKLKVTNRDIKEGNAGTTDSCPVALAALRAGFEEPSVSDNKIELKTPAGSTLRIRTPRSVAKFIERFDEDKSVRPGTFTLEF